nr:hypothetical protein Iba_chr08dCG11290 [Ipomoea batatas]
MHPDVDRRCKYLGSGEVASGSAFGTFSAIQPNHRGAYCFDASPRGFTCVRRNQLFCPSVRRRRSVDHTTDDPSQENSVPQ